MKIIDFIKISISSSPGHFSGELYDKVIMGLLRGSKIEKMDNSWKTITKFEHSDVGV